MCHSLAPHNPKNMGMAQKPLEPAVLVYPLPNRPPRHRPFPTPPSLQATLVQMASRRCIGVVEINVQGWYASHLKLISSYSSKVLVCMSSTIVEGIECLREAEMLVFASSSHYEDQIKSRRGSGSKTKKIRLKRVEKVATIPQKVS